MYHEDIQIYLYLNSKQPLFRNNLMVNNYKLVRIFKLSIQFMLILGP